MLFFLVEASVSVDKGAQAVHGVSDVTKAGPEGACGEASQLLHLKGLPVLRLEVSALGQAVPDGPLDSSDLLQTEERLIQTCPRPLQFIDDRLRVLVGGPSVRGAHHPACPVSRLERLANRASRIHVFLVAHIACL